ncbi:MAG TPA: LppX_LprAFG lipoprotein [Nocardioides sp.]|uniref:LppX_LprAFG lipoprotein n=1 Tax=Nocardioides sp. TaxID=35761 RepID=UPI002D800960|nr:LppX_LprAFG lipoprotein [Nocardioides sp.]HET6654332.1 LppX_LprAFG lipoprotein [Nocardioides sp.]
MRTDRVLNRVLTGVAGSALLLTMTACGGDEPAADESQGSASSSVASAEPSEESESAEPTETTEEEVSGGYDAAELLDRMKAAIADNESAHVTMEMTGGQQMSGEGDVSYAGDETAMQMNMQIPQMGSGTMEMRMIDGVIYMAMPPLTPKGKFFEIDTNDPNSPFGDLGGVTQGDPLATFDAFDAGLEDARYVGEEDVDGEQLDHYVLTVDAEKAAEAQGQQTQPGMPETITYDMWIDDEDLMRRIEFDLGDVAGGGGGMVMTMSDWGTPVTVKAPPRTAILQMPGGVPAQ